LELAYLKGPGDGAFLMPRRKDVPMSTTKRQTMGKMNRERELREKRELKQARKEEKKLAAAAAAATETEAPVVDPTSD